MPNQFPKNVTNSLPGSGSLNLDETARYLSVSRSTIQRWLDKSVGEIRQYLDLRGVVLSSGAVITTLGAGSAEAAPTTLTLALGKLAVAGTTGSTAFSLASGVVLTGGLLVMKKVLIVVGILVVAAFLAKETLFKPAVSVSAKNPVQTSGLSVPSEPVKAASSPDTESAQSSQPSENSSLTTLLTKKLKGQDDGSISGIVVDLQGRPIPEMQVFSVDFSTSKVKTGTDGRFEIKGLTAGEYALTVRKGSGPFRFAETEKGTLVKLASGEHRTEIKLVYDRIWTISGRILSREGNPIADAKVVCSGAKTGGSSARSGANGTFCVENLADGVYGINVIAKGYQQFEIWDIKAGRDDVDITLIPVTLITGRVLDAVTGHPIPEFKAGLFFQCEGGLWEGWRDQLETVNNPEGRFSFPATQPIHYFMVVQAQGYFPESQPAYGGETAQPQQELVFRLQKGGGDLHGFVRDSEGHPIPDVQVMYGTIGSGIGTPLKTGMQGEFVLNNFPRQTQLVSAYHPSYAIGDITIPENADLSKPVEIVLAQGGMIRGNVKVASAIENARITIELLHAKKHFPDDRYKAILPPQGGAFELHSIQPGNAELNVWRSWLSTPGEQRQSIVIPVVIDDAKTKEIKVDFPLATGVIEGTVQVDSISHKERRKRIVLQFSGTSGECYYLVVPEASGLYRIEGVIPGHGTLEYIYEREDGQSEQLGSVPVTLAEGQVLHHDFTATPEAQQP